MDDSDDLFRQYRMCAGSVAVLESARTALGRMPQSVQVAEAAAEVEIALAAARHRMDQARARFLAALGDRVLSEGPAVAPPFGPRVGSLGHRRSPGHPHGATRPAAGPRR